MHLRLIQFPSSYAIPLLKAPDFSLPQQRLPVCFETSAYDQT